MKSFFTVLVAVLLTTSVFAQAPEKMSYQAVIRNSSNVLVTNSQIGMEINIRQGSATGTVVYTETQTPTTNGNGLVSIEIGGAGFSSINWAGDDYYIETKTAVVAPLTTYTITGVSQLLSVPYALQAKTAENGITTVQANEITANTLKVGYTDALVSANADVVANSAKVGITTVQANEITANTLKVGYTDALVSANADVVANSAKVGITTVQANEITANTSKVGQASGTTAGQMQYWNGTAWVTVTSGNEGQILMFNSGVPTWTTTAGLTTKGPTDVYNPTTDKIWMDRNLGATQVATSSTDVAAYGDLYQWGRGTDGHQIRTSGTTTTLSSTDNPGNGNFILAPSSPNDWRSPQNTNLWQGVSGVNNPCPSGYRLPTEVELDNERASWSSQNSAGAYASPLKLTVAGYHFYIDGSLGYVGFYGYYWSSTVGSTYSRYLYFGSSVVSVNSSGRARGLSVRCIKD